jgi:DNA-binding NarL/FixJ family response regulator
LLEGVYEDWIRAERHLDAARTMTSIGMIERATAPAAAMQRLTAARGALVEIGARRDADYLASILRGMGTRTRVRNKTSDVGNLTQRELEIARLVSSGLRNAEVAEKLFLAEKTVASHLSNVYGKLSINSRIQLHSWLAKHDQQVEELQAV